MGRVIGLSFLLALLLGCQTVPVGPPVTSQVITDPPGARIEVDNNLIGVSPLTVVWNGNYVRSFRDRSHVVRAYPIYEGQYTQTKFFSGGYTNSQSYWNGYSYVDIKTPNDSLNSPIPDTIYFDMNIVPAPNQYNVNIR